MKSWHYSVSMVFAAIIFLVLPLSIGLYRASVASYQIDQLSPSIVYRIHMWIFFKAADDTIRIRAYLPKNEREISLGARWTDTDLINSSELYKGGNRLLEWWGDTPGLGKIETSFSAMAKPVIYNIDPELTVPGTSNDPNLPFLEATESIQVNASEIYSLAQELAPEGSPSADALRRIYSYCSKLDKSIETSTHELENTEDALGTLRDQAGGALGKARLFAALTRQIGFPTRLVHGAILNPGYNQVPTTWVEVRLGLEWVPFCPTRKLFARTDGRLLPFVRGDISIASSDSPSETRIRFDVEQTFAFRGRLVSESAEYKISWLKFWGALEEAGISVDVLCIVLMLPFGAFVSVLLRNVVGLRTLGFFGPMLIAVAAMRSGLIWAIGGFLFVIVSILAFRLLTGPLRLLHFPQQAATLTLTVISVVGLAAIGTLTGNLNLAHLTYLPIVVLTIATEQFFSMVDEEEPTEVLKVIIMTIIAIGLCYAVMSSYSLQRFALAFPESLIAMICLDILIGCWMGIRLLEYLRFRWLTLPEKMINYA